MNILLGVMGSWGLLNWYVLVIFTCVFGMLCEVRAYFRLLLVSAPLTSTSSIRNISYLLGESRGREFDPGPRSHTFVKIDHEIISTVILLPSADSFKGLLSVTSESMCTKYWLTACSSLPRKKCG